MAKKKRGGAHTGGHGWFVTFADLMGLMMSFFVMLVAFSNQDQQKLQIVAGSMRDAFVAQNNVRYSGIIAVDGLPTPPKPDEHRPNPQNGGDFKDGQGFCAGGGSVRQALQDMPELTEASKHIMVE